MVEIETKVVNGQKKYICVYQEEPQEGESLEVEVGNLWETFKKDQRLYDYFVALIDLSAIMCMGRNTTGIESLEEKYKQDFCVDLVMSS